MVVEFLVVFMWAEKFAGMGNLALNVGLNAQVVLWVQPLSSLSDFEPSPLLQATPHHDKGSTWR